MDPLKHINGVTIEEIESRAAPLLDNTEDKERFRVRSSVGFLAPGESFLSRLECDSRKVNQLCVTHEHLACELEKVLNEASKERKRIGAGPDRPISIDFAYQPHPNEPQALQSVVKSQTLSVSRRSFMGSQWSFFRNLDADHTPTEEDTISWKEDHEVSNNAFSQIVITVSGGVGTGICHYISKYGFYEGGKSNRYRVDPTVLHWVLTGIPSVESTTEVLLFCHSSKNDARAQLSRQLKELEFSGNTPESRISAADELSRSCDEEISRYEAIEAEVEAIIAVMKDQR